MRRKLLGAYGAVTRTGGSFEKACFGKVGCTVILAQDGQ